MRIQDRPQGAFGGGAEKRIALKPVLVEDTGLAHGAVRVHGHLYFDAQILGFLGPGGQAPTLPDLLTDQIDLADRKRQRRIEAPCRRRQGLGNLGIEGFLLLLFLRRLLFLLLLSRQDLDTSLPK